MGTGATGPHGAVAIRGFLRGWHACCATNTVGVSIVASSSCQRRFWRCITAITNAGITPTAIWWRFTVTVTTRYTEAVGIARSGMVLMTKADLLEEPCARKPARTVLQTSGGSDPLAEFNRPLRRAVLWRRRSFGTQSEAGSQFVERILTAVTTLRQQRRDVLDFLTTACTAAICKAPAPSLFPLTSPPLVAR